MIILTVLSVICIVFVIGVNIIEFFTNGRFKDKTYNVLLILFGLSFAFLASQIVPPAGWDLKSHYLVIDQIRKYGFEYAITQSHYHNQIVITLFFYLVSLLNSNKWLVFITVIIEYSLFIHVQSEIVKKYNNVNGRALCFFIFPAFLNIVLSISGIRNVLAFTIATYAILRMFIIKQGKISNWVLIILALLIHPSVFYFVFLLILLYFIKNKKVVYIVLLLLPFITSFLGQKLAASNNAFLQSIGSGFMIYNTGDFILSYDWRMLIINVICVFSLFLSLHFFEKKAKNRFQIPSEYVGFLKSYLFLMLASLYLPLLFNRLLYGLALLLIPYVISSYNQRSFRLFRIMLFCYSWFAVLYQLYEIYTTLRV